MPSVITNVYYELQHKHNDGTIEVGKLCFVCATNHIIDNRGSQNLPHVILRNTYKGLSCDHCGRFIWDSIHVNVQPTEIVEYKPMESTQTED